MALGNRITAVRSTLVCLLLAASVAAVGEAAWFLDSLRHTDAALRDTVKALPAQFDARAQKIQDAATAEVDKHAAVLEAKLDRGMAAAQAELSSTRSAFVGESTAWRQTAADQLGRANDSLAQTREDLKPAIAGAHDTLAQASSMIHDLHPQALGLVAAAKVTAGETAQTMRDFRGAVPGFLAQGQDIAKNFQSATLRFSGVADNLDRLTKPRWYDRALGYSLTGLTMYRELNPAQQVVIGITRALSSQHITGGGSPSAATARALAPLDTKTAPTRKGPPQ